MLRSTASTLAYVALFGAFLLTPAGRPVPWRAWVLLAVLFAVRLAGNLAIQRVHPGLLRERAKPPVQRGQPLADKWLLGGFMASFGSLVSAASADGFRFHVLGTASPAVAAVGLLLFALGWALAAMALRSNAFALAVIKPQEQQAVVRDGPYRIVRHPLYLGLVIVMIGMSLWIRSYLGVCLAIVPSAILCARIGVEEAFLARHVAGYGGYARDVRYRLLPFVW